MEVIHAKLCFVYAFSKPAFVIVKNQCKKLYKSFSVANPDHPKKRGEGGHPDPEIRGVRS